MKAVDHSSPDPRLREAIAELRQLIRDHHPEAIFSIGIGDDPEGVWLTATVDVDDPDEVVDLYIDRILEMQVEEGLPLHVLPVRTPERIEAMLRAREAGATAALVPLD